MNTLDIQKQIRSRQVPSSMHGFGTLTRFQAQKTLCSLNCVFVLGIPVCMYLIFGQGQSYSDQPLPHGNVGATVLVSMAQYAAVLVAMMLCAQIAIECSQGWHRTMMLTPLGAAKYSLSKVAASLIAAGIAVCAVYLVGFFTGAKMDAVVWLETFLLIIVLCVSPALLGLLVGLLVPGEEAYALVGGGSSLLGFLSGMFIPLEILGKTFQKIAEFTPLWGINRIALCGLFGWDEFESKWLVNVFAWTVILLVGVILAARRSARR